MAPASRFCRCGAQGVVTVSWNGSNVTSSLRAERDALRVTADLLDRRLAQGVGRRAQVEGEADAAGNDIACARRRLDASDGGDHVVGGIVLCNAFDREHDLGRSGQCVMPHRHRHRSGMPGLAEHHDPYPALTDDARDHAERKILGLQHGSLLDMQFDICRGVLACVSGLRDIGDILAVGFDRLRQRHAIAVGKSERRLVEYPGTRRRGRECRAETRSLFVAEGQDIDRERKLGLSGRQMLDGENSRHHAKRTVIAAGIDHGVDMRSDQQAAIAARALRPPVPAHGPECIFRHRHSAVFHPARDAVGGAAMFRGQEQADQPVGIRRDRAKLGQHCFGARADRRVPCRGRVRNHRCARIHCPSVSRSASVITV